MSAHDEGLTAEVQRLEIEVREAAQKRAAAVATLRAELASTEARVQALEFEVTQLEVTLQRAQRTRDEAVDDARRAEAHLSTLQAQGATRDAPLNHARRRS